MRSLFAVALAAALAVAWSPSGRAAPLCAAPPTSTAQSPLLRQVKFVCGQFEDGFSCKFVPGESTEGARGQYKGPPATPGASRKSAPDSAPPAIAPTPEGSWGATTTQQQPSQPPPRAAQSCPPNTELLGGNCVPYTARCTNGMALNAVPQPCAGLEEKQACKARPDGLKDCCCITYSKF